MATGLRSVLHFGSYTGTEKDIMSRMTCLQRWMKLWNIQGGTVDHVKHTGDAKASPMFNDNYGVNVACKTDILVEKQMC